MREIKGLATSIEFLGRGSVKTVTGVDKIHSNVITILLTPLGTRFRQPTFGSKLTRYVLQPNDAFLKENLEKEIIEALGIWEPRVTVLEIEVSQSEKQVQISIEYRIRSLDTTETVTFILEDKEI